ncbi:hypothetical protein PLEI_3056 [Photobacterium leiognathi lrivu.4.1]|uniref:Uncharacterized protein n=1 Tax=Photobacterium leiognathi lrivu.4.1 TaxID=1248232 RepID=V5ENP5_PHOLE|nr:hypothetical protein PLEI_3056 [Photobacterium leiognathi lrivu.4.1]
MCDNILIYHLNLRVVLFCFYWVRMYIIIISVIYLVEDCSRNKNSIKNDAK